MTDVKHCILTICVLTRLCAVCISEVCFMNMSWTMPVGTVIIM